MAFPGTSGTLARRLRRLVVMGMTTVGLSAGAVAAGMIVKEQAAARLLQAKLAWATGNHALEERHAEAAYALFSQAMRLDPHWSAPLASRGNASLSIMNYSAAIADFKAAIAIDPGCAPCWYSLGNTYWLIGQLPAAEEAFRTLYTLRPDDAHAAGRLASVMYEQNRPADAEAMYHDSYSRRHTAWSLSGWLSAVGARGPESVIATCRTVRAAGDASNADADAVLSYHEGRAQLAGGEAQLKDGKAQLAVALIGAAIAPLKVAAGAEAREVPSDVFELLAAAEFAVGDTAACFGAMHEYAARQGRSDELSAHVCDPKRQTGRSQ
jgi:hypothetical protein